MHAWKSKVFWAALGVLTCVGGAVALRPAERSIEVPTLRTRTALERRESLWAGGELAQGFADFRREVAGFHGRPTTVHSSARFANCGRSDGPKVGRGARLAAHARPRSGAITPDPR